MSLADETREKWAVDNWGGVAYLVILALISLGLVGLWMYMRRTGALSHSEGGPGEPAPGDDEPRVLRRVVVRVYAAPQQSDAVAAFQSDSSELAEYGYRPVSQSWAQGQWDAGAWIIALLLCVVLIGFLVFAYMLIVKPDGTLTVTYQLAETSAPQEPGPPSSASIRERIAQLDDLRAAGVISDEEYAAKRAKIIDAL
jgi:hypothetical protein